MLPTLFAIACATVLLCVVSYHYTVRINAMFEHGYQESVLPGRSDMGYTKP